jgi:antitoxin component YwqK of YwqJK toxin-antitoxin module
MSLKASQEDGSFFKITLPEAPLIGTYTWSVYEPSAPGFYLAYYENAVAIPYVAARDNAGEFANFPTYTDTAELVIYGIDRANKRISGSFKFTGVRFTDETETAVETKEFTFGNFQNLPYTSTAVEEPIDENSVLPSKMVESYPGQGIADKTSEFKFFGNKITKEIITPTDGRVETKRYTYNSENLISKVESETNGNVDKRETFEYENGKLITYISEDILGGTAIKETYSHETGGSISVARFSGNLTTQDTPEGTSIISFNTDGEVSQIEFSSGSIKTYTYDDENYVFKNVQGFDKISFVDGEATGISRNITTKTEGDLPFYDYQFTYTDANFPLKRTDIGVEVNYFY